MSTSNTSWDDTGFDDEASSASGASGGGGFKKSPPNDPPPSVENTTPAVEHAPLPPPHPPQYTRVEPPPTAPPPVPERRSRWGTVFLIAALFLIVTAVGYIVSTFFMRDPTEQEAFFDPNPERVETLADPVDTVAVALAPVEAPAAEVPAPNDNIVDSSPRQLSSSMRPKKTPPDEVPDKPSTPSDAKTPSASALYVVQVFSSPSRDDADEWLQILRERNVSDGFITEQRLGGEAWYRVRFGQYSSRQDAEAAAQQLGFANPWIARVR